MKYVITFFIYFFITVAITACYIEDSSETEVTKNVTIAQYKYKKTVYGSIVKICIDKKSFLINATDENIIQVFDVDDEGNLIPESCFLEYVITQTEEDRIYE